METSLLEEHVVHDMTCKLTLCLPFLHCEAVTLPCSLALLLCAAMTSIGMLMKVPSQSAAAAVGVRGERQVV